MTRTTRLTITFTILGLQETNGTTKSPPILIYSSNQVLVLLQKLKKFLVFHSLGKFSFVKAMHYAKSLFLAIKSIFLCTLTL